MVLSDPQLQLLAFTLGVPEENTDKLATRMRASLPRRINLFMRLMRQTAGRKMALEVQPCSWNMLFSRRCAFFIELNGETHLVNRVITWLQADCPNSDDAGVPV